MKRFFAACLPSAASQSVHSEEEEAAPRRAGARAYGAQGYELVGDVGKCQAATHDMKLMRNRATGGASPRSDGASCSVGSQPFLSQPCSDLGAPRRRACSHEVDWSDTR